MYEPLGVVAAITPWNIPFGIPFAVVANASPPGTPRPQAVRADAADRRVGAAEPARGSRRAGGARPARTGEAPVGEALVAEPGIAEVLHRLGRGGRRVAAAAGARGCPGRARARRQGPLVVFADADLDRARCRRAFRLVLEHGLACVSAERTTSSGRPTTNSPAALEQAARELKLGVEVGPLISERQRDTVERLSPAKRPSRTGRFLEPTVVRGALPDQGDLRPGRDRGAVRRRGRRGPARERQRVRSRRKRLVRDLAKADRVARRIEAGMIWVNDFGYSFTTGQASWGGVKSSGFGRRASS